jgi:FkbM family methyltransferase
MDKADLGQKQDGRTRINTKRDAVTELSLDMQLEAILSEDAGSVVRRERTTFDELTAPLSRALVLFGAGRLGRTVLAGLRKAGVEPLAFTDNNPALWGKAIDGVQVLSPKDCAWRFGQKAAFVVTIWNRDAVDRMADRQRQLVDLGCAKVVSFVPLMWKYSRVFLPHYCLDLPHKLAQQADDIRKALGLWADGTSRSEYVAQVGWRALSDFDRLATPIVSEQYFPDELLHLSSSEVFVDCGAFDGDTISSFIQRQGASFSKIIAFEPDPTNVQNLQRRISGFPDVVQAKIALMQLAVGSHRGKVRFGATGTESSAVGEGALEVNCIPLDEALAGCVPTYIKMDIEGSELEALSGARKTIERTTPILAACVYHRQGDLWQIPLLIRSMSDDYRLYLRPHGSEGWELVCYAVPASRLSGDAIRRQLK